MTDYHERSPQICQGYHWLQPVLMNPTGSPTQVTIPCMETVAEAKKAGWKSVPNVDYKFQPTGLGRFVWLCPECYERYRQERAAKMRWLRQRAGELVKRAIAEENFAVADPVWDLRERYDEWIPTPEEWDLWSEETEFPKKF